MLTAEIVLKAETGGIKENLKVTIGDLAGNTGEKSVDNFILSANIFQRFFANPVLVICTFAGLALVIAAVIFFVVKKRKRLNKVRQYFNDSGVSSFGICPKRKVGKICFSAVIS